ncbi:MULTISPECIES: hypothetical protein, partial [unclassified Shewanella]|uniref:hypothetical protein n=1 Tax=unclassified Shewanella TaxID=196818 RepID=UPI0039B39589
YRFVVWSLMSLFTSLNDFTRLAWCPKLSGQISIKKSDDMGSSDFDPFSEIVKRSVLTDRHYRYAGFFIVFQPQV